MDKKCQKVLFDYHQRIESENRILQKLGPKGFKRRNEFLLPIGKEVGQFLNALIKGASARTILEVGTAYGYSTIWMAEAARETSGKVISLEIDSAKIAHAKFQIRAAGLDEYVDFRVGDALETIHHAQEKFDLVLLDIWKELYLPCFELFYPKLKNNAYVIADNMLFPKMHLQDTNKYKSAIRSSEHFDSVLLPIGGGIEVSQRRTLNMHQKD